MHLLESNTFAFQRFVKCFVFLLCLNVSFQAAEYGFDQWTTANGLPQNTVNSVTQTPDGYLWLSTFDGLARFDGVKFTIFDKGNSRGIINNRFTGIFTDREGVVWAYTENGVITVYGEGVFTSYSTPEGSREGIVGIMADAKGKALFETTERYYYLQDGKLIPAPEQKEKGSRVIYYAKSGAKWTIETNRVTQQKDDRIIVYPIETEPFWLSSTIGISPFEDKTGALWIRVNGRIANFRNGALKIYTTQEIPGLKDQAGVSFFEDQDDNIFATVYNSPTTVKIIQFKGENMTAFDLGETASVRFPAVDSEGNIWLASPTGLRRMRRQIINTLSVKDGLNNDEIYPVLQARNGDVYIGSTQGLNRYADGEMKNFKLQYAVGGAFYMRGLWQDSEGRIWLGFQGEGGFGLLEKSDSVKRLTKEDLQAGATDFASDRDGNVWIATEKGLLKYKDDREIARYTVKDGLQNDKIITLHFDHDDHLWLGTFDGLAQFKDGRFTNFNNIENSPKGFVRVIYEDPEGILWFGTYGDGLVRYKNGKFFNYRVEDGLFNNGVFAILEDDSGNFWMSSNRGIYRLARQELNDFADGKIPKLTSISYDEKDGMQTVECNGGRIPAAFKAKDGKLWFATMGGVAIVDPKAEKTNPNPPPVIIENVAVDRKIIDNQLFQSAIRNPQSKIELLPGQTNFEIDYTGLSFIKSNQIKFRYKLEGFEENFVEAGTRRTANYSYLPAGNYTFRVIAANANGVWNNEGASIKITVYPYFYQTWWFRTLTILAVGLIIWLIYHNRVSYLRKIADTKTQFSRQLIASQEAERKRIAAELHDGLGQSLLVIKTRTTLGKKVSPDNEKMLGQFEEISKAAGQALDEVRTIAYNLRPYHLERLGLNEAIEAMLEKICEVANLEIKAHVSLSDEVFSKDDEVTFYRIIQECLNNIIKHSNATTAEIRIVQNENEVIAKISDNGRGFVAVAENQAKGFGLIGMSERIRMLGGTHNIESEPDKGTKIMIIIPRREEKIQH